MKIECIRYLIDGDIWDLHNGRQTLSNKLDDKLSRNRGIIIRLLDEGLYILRDMGRGTVPYKTYNRYSETGNY